ncbi:MAG: M6 family metalloprotease domain-containing protein [Muribaculaceae bacterium]|nr:M6 family metalloprotease domain-containing protein [Muribaculaceae bacterium]
MRQFIFRIVLLTIVAFCANNGTKAIIAYPNPIRITVERDTFYLSLRGNENCKFAITDDGYIALPDTNGWYYACTNSIGEVVKSKYKVSSERNRDATTRSFLKTQTQGLIPTYKPDTLRINKSTTRASTRASGNPIIGDRRILIILMQFSDLKFKKSLADFDRLFNEPNYRDDGAYGSVYDYYNKVSYGQLNLKCDVLGPYTASRDMAYYGGNSSHSGGGDRNPKALFDEAIQYAVGEVNLADYDSDGDGFIDNVHIIYAGYGEEAGAPANAIWAHEMTFTPESINGMMIDRYSCSPELRGNSGVGITRIGAPCHEIGHALGAMDFYDVDYQTGGYYEGTGDWDIMASGSWNDEGARPADLNPYVKAYTYRWVDVPSLDTDTINFISPSAAVNNIYRIDTPVNGEYFLLENRQSEGINSAEPGKGLLIYHIGPQIKQKEATNTINSTYPQQCYVVCASAKDVRPRASAQSYGNINSSGCPYPGSSNNMSFNNSSIPGAFCVNGQSAEVSLTNITQKSNGDISLYFGKDSPGDVPPPDEPTNDDEIEGELIWSDDFEVTNHYLTQNWTVENLSGNGNWIVKTYSSIPSEKEPPVLNGNRYMAMEASETGIIMGDDKRYSCRIISNAIQLNAGEYVLTGRYGGYSSRKLSQDTLNVKLKTGIDEEWISYKSLHIKKRSEWDSLSIPITVTEAGSLYVAFEGNAEQKSLLFLDNLKLYKPYTGNIPQHSAETNEPVYVFNLNGIYLGNQELLNSLPSGIYIVRQGKKVRKLMIK